MRGKMKHLFIICSLLILGNLNAGEESYSPYISYMIHHNGITIPSIGVEYEKDKDKFDVSLGYSCMYTYPSAHYSLLTFGYGRSVWDIEKKDLSVVGGLRLKMLKCKDHEYYHHAKFMLYPYIGMSLKITAYSKMEITYHPIYFHRGEIYKRHESCLRLIFHL